MPRREVSDHLCECGCGEFTLRVQMNNTAKGWVKGEPHRFVVGHARRLNRPDPNPECRCLCGCGGETPSPKVRYLKSQDDGCWTWVRGRDGKGYGLCRENGKLVKAHRWVWERQNGPLPVGIELHHRCETPSCVNPDHLEPLSKSEHASLHWEMRRAA